MTAGLPPVVIELSDPYTNFMLNPRPGPGICPVCCTFAKPGYTTCGRCQYERHWLAAVAPISYSVAGKQLHHALATYKRGTGAAARQLEYQLTAVLWRSLAAHERCLAAATGVDEFPLVTCVPSSSATRDATHPLHRMVGDYIRLTRDRHERLIRRSATPVGERAYDPRRFEATRSLNGEAVLLIDDTWTTGARAQTAAAAVLAVGAGSVSAVVIGRHINPEWEDNERRLAQLPEPFDWATCSHHG